MIWNFGVGFRSLWIEYDTYLPHFTPSVVSFNGSAGLNAHRGKKILHSVQSGINRYRIWFTTIENLLQSFISSRLGAFLVMQVFIGTPEVIERHVVFILFPLVNTVIDPFYKDSSQFHSNSRLFEYEISQANSDQFHPISGNWNCKNWNWCITTSNMSKNVLNRVFIDKRAFSASESAQSGCESRGGKLPLRYQVTGNGEVTRYRVTGNW